MAGRKPKPTALKKLEGNPGKRKLNTKEPVPGKGMPDCPKWLLPEAKEEWKRLCKKLSEMGVLTEIDMAAFAAYCQSYARWKEAQEHIDSEGSTFETENGYRQFRTAFVEICKKVGKSELAAAVALYLLYADNEPSAEVYGAAADRQQASIVFDVARQMVEMSPALLKRSKLMTATKRIVNYGNSGYYQVLSAEVGGKHGFSVSGLVFDEIHTQPNRQLYDVLTKGSSDARQNPLHFIITTAGTDRHSIAFELHTKALDILEGRRVDPTFYPVVYGLKDDEDWEDEANWYKVNPSLGYTVDIERLRDAYREAKQNPADEVTFKWLRLNMWVSSTVAWIPDAIFMKGNEEIDLAALEGRDCYGGLDLSSTGDITALVLMFPPRDEDEKYILLPFFWVPEETIPQRVKAASVPYDIWEKQGFLLSTEGNVIHYDFIEKFINDLAEKYHIVEIAVDRWNATQMIQNLEGDGIDGKDVTFRASAAIPRIYRNRFHRDIYKDLHDLQKSIDQEDPEASALDSFSLELFEDISYIMAKHADPQNVPDTPDEWLDQFGTFSIYQVLPEIIELWGLNVQTQVESKKNFERLTGK